MTVYGTQLLLPFSNHPFGVGSVFIIDPLYTLPLMGAPAGRRPARPPRAAPASSWTAYLAGVSREVERIARASLAAQGIRAEQVLVTPTAFNSVLWRVLAWRRALPRGLSVRCWMAMRPSLSTASSAAARWQTRCRVWKACSASCVFSKGFYKLHEDGRRVRISDLRMGQEPSYIFSFEVAERRSPPVALAVAEQVGERVDFGRALPWLWRRAQGEPVPPPR